MGGAQMVLKAPIEEQCEHIGLESCPDIAEGSVLYVDGDQQGGTAKLRTGLRANTDMAKELKELAVAMRGLEKLPGASQYVAALDPVRVLIEEAAKEAEEKATKQAEVEEVGTEEAVTGPTTARVDTVGGLQRGSAAEPLRALGYELASGYMAPADPKTTRRCMIDVGRECQCVYKVGAASEITALFSSPLCQTDLFVYAMSDQKPTWLFWAPAGQGIALRAVSLPVEARSVLAVCATIPDGSEMTELTPDPHCGMTWLGVTAPEATNSDEFPSRRM